MYLLIPSQTDVPTISADFLKSATRFGLATRLLHDLSYLSIAVNESYHQIDPQQFKSLEKLRHLAEMQHPYLRGMSTYDPLIAEGRAIMYNRQTPNHPDRNDPLKSWACMVTLGHFTQGGELYIERLNLVIRYLPGDMIWVRGRILPHEVWEWNDGQRISIAHFTHETLWRSYGMECP